MKNKRPPLLKRQFYIKQEFQNRFILLFLCVLILGGLISVCLTYWNTRDTLTSAYVNSQLVIQSTSLAIMPSVIYTTLITVLVLIVIVGILTLLVSHKIAGPMYRFESDLKRISTGDLRCKIQIRKGDQLQDLVVSLNQLVESFNGKIGEIEALVKALKKEPDLPPGCRDKIEALEATLKSNFKR